MTQLQQTYMLEQNVQHLHERATVLTELVRQAVSKLRQKYP